MLEVLLVAVLYTRMDPPVDPCFELCSVLDEEYVETQPDVCVCYDPVIKRTNHYRRSNAAGMPKT